MKTGVFSNPLVKRFVACLALGLALAIMVGPQQGTQQDYGLAFREAVFAPRVFIFLGIGVAVFFVVTFWPRITPYFKRPGVFPLAVGGITVVAAQTLLKWHDPTGDGKFHTVADAAAGIAGLAPLASVFFGWLAWTLLVVTVLVAGAGIVLDRKVLGWVAAGLAIFGVFIVLVASAAFEATSTRPDHSLGAGVAVVGYLVIAAAAVTIAMSRDEIADTKAFFARLLAWRPGLPLTVIGAVVGIIGVASATWYSPSRINATLVDTAAFFGDRGLAPLAEAYLSWLGYAVFGVALILAAAASYLRITVLGWVALVVGLAGLYLTLNTMYLYSSAAAVQKLEGVSGPWQNLGTGGWMTSAALFLFAGTGFVVATAGRRAPRTIVAGGQKVAAPRSSDAGLFSNPVATKTLLLGVFAVALFYPPTATSFWQSVLVTQIGIYVLLAVGLNVVVGWAGLLDLGFIAFYAIGSYVTAYLVGSLPIKPPSWLEMSPLWAIPFAILVCLVAGVILGGPTLRLRGDYLAIVTLGFGEIVRIVAINADDVTNSTRGPSPQVPHPVINLGFVRFEFGLNQLQYWYLLLIIIVIVVVLFRALEQSRTGRAWAAIREDEIAAQATGVNTTRVKLLAFAIGASTSGLAGVFFASDVGFFTPDNFILNNSILVVAYVVFGGMGSLPGAMAGAAVLTWLPEFLKDQVPAEDRQMWIGAVVLLMMIFRPGGLIPAKRRAAELHGFDDDTPNEPRAVPAGEGMGARA
jgi:ABC-type branched-subunit amino acid transport system permease subunit